jgi:hypothetical protein
MDVDGMSPRQSSVPNESSLMEFAEPCSNAALTRSWVERGAAHHCQALSSQWGVRIVSKGLQDCTRKLSMQSMIHTG